MVRGADGKRLRYADLITVSERANRRRRLGRSRIGSMTAEERKAVQNRALTELAHARDEEQAHCGHWCRRRLPTARLIKPESVALRSTY